MPESGLIQLIVRLLDVYQLIIVVRALMSWFHPDPEQPIVRLILQITDPVLGVFQKITHKFAPNAMIDFSPILALIVIQGVQTALATLVNQYP